MSIPEPRLDITKFLISTPCFFVGQQKSEHYNLTKVSHPPGIGNYSPNPTERVHREFWELTVETPTYDGKTIVIPNYSLIGEQFCNVLTVLFGKRFDFHGLTLQHGYPYLPPINRAISIYNKNLTFNSLSIRADFPLDLNVINLKYIENVLFEQKDAAKELAQETFLFAAKFYSQAIQTVEETPEIAYLCLITAGEILASSIDYSSEDLLDSDTKELLNSLLSLGEVGIKLHKKVSTKLLGIAESFCKFFIEALDDEFFKRTEAKNSYEKLTNENIRRRLKAAYTLRSKYVHAGKSHAGWMSVNYLHNNEEVLSGKPVIQDKELRPAIANAPTFIGLERITRYALLKFLIRHEIIDAF